ncbi:hypothetical protein GSbR_38050 [Geobacter sp. SVR]|nr:oligosaccharide repeat unit polymerase [Geobacter sp. SVR]BCS51980.1 hypothetical protein GSVR_02880 [Geobacter sp. SVR]GCF87205.1 hypothetical protein GSbR_38050 [Geobacter sp. SVR]
MLEHIAGLSFISYLAVLMSLIAVQMLVLRDKIWNMFDPLLLIVLNISLNASIVVFLYLNGQAQLSYALYVLAGTILFCLGVKTKRLSLGKRPIHDPKASGLSRKFTIILLSISLFYLAISSLYMLSQIGLGILTGDANPDLVKVTLTQDGLGAFKHIGAAGDLLFLPLVAYAFFSLRIRRFSLFCLFCYAVRMILFPLSKSGLVFAIFDLGIIMHFYKYHFSSTIISVKKVLLIGLAGIIPAAIVLFNVTSKYESTILSLVIERLIVTGFGTYQYFISGGKEFLDSMVFGERLLHYFDTLLSSLRIKPWEEMSHVAKMTYHITGNYLPGFGANPYIFMDGHFLFGWGGGLYCYLIGVAIAWSRRQQTNFLIFYLAVKLSAYLVADPAILQAQLIALLLYVPPVLLLYAGAKCTNRSTHLNLRRVHCAPGHVYEKA